MAQIREDYVSFEIAKLLKEKGFDSDEVGCHGGFYSERCYESGHGIITQSGQEVDIVYDDLTNSDLDYDEYLRPTLQMAMKWLREVHKLVICAEIGNENSKGNTDYSNPDRWYWFFDITNEKGVVIDTESDFVLNEYTTYEEACEAGIKYCLKHLI